MVVPQQAQVGERVLDLAALVEARAAHQLVAQAIAQEGLLDGPALGVRAIHDRHVLEAIDIVIAFIGPARQHGAGAAPAGHERLHLAGHPLGLLVLAVRLEALDEGAAGVLRPELLVLAALVALHDGVGGVEDELRGAVVLLQLDDRGLRVVLLEVEDVAQVRASPAVDGLVVVAHDGHVAVLGGEQLDPQVLGAVGVLVLVDVEVAPPAAVVGKDRGRLLEEPHGLDEQVVEVERGGLAEPLGIGGVGAGHVRLQVAAGLLVGLEGTDELVLPAADGREHGSRAQLGPSTQLQVAQDLLDDAGLVVGVVDGEARVDADGGPIATQHSRAEGVEGAHGHLPTFVADEGQDALAHLRGRLVGERHGQDLPGRHAFDADEVGDAMGQHPGLAGARTGQDEERATGRGHRAGLFGVQPAGDGRGQRRGVGGALCLRDGIRPRTSRRRLARRGGDHGEPLGVVGRRSLVAARTAVARTSPVLVDGPRCRSSGAGSSGGGGARPSGGRGASSSLSVGSGSSGARGASSSGSQKPAGGTGLERGVGGGTPGAPFLAGGTA